MRRTRVLRSDAMQGAVANAEKAGAAATFLLVNSLGNVASMWVGMTV